MVVYQILKDNQFLQRSGQESKMLSHQGNCQEITEGQKLEWFCSTPQHFQHTPPTKGGPFFVAIINCNIP